MPHNTPDKKSKRKWENFLQFMSDEERVIADAPLSDIHQDLRENGINPDSLRTRFESEKARLEEDRLTPEVSTPASLPLKQTLRDWFRRLAPVSPFVLAGLLLIGVLPLLVLGPRPTYRGTTTEPDIVQTLESLNRKRHQFEQAKDYGKAVIIAEKIVSVVSSYRGGEHPDTATALNNLALMYKKAQRWGPAVTAYQRAIVIQKAALGAGHKDTLTTMENLRILYQTRGMEEQAAQLSREIKRLQNPPAR